MNDEHPTSSTPVNSDIPEGFRRLKLGGGYLTANGPLYTRVRDGRVQVGFRVEARHCNPTSVCHGGMLATFADMFLVTVAHHGVPGERRFLPTISLQLDYLGAAPLGAWVEGEGEVLRATRNLVFVQGVARIDGAPVLRASGTFKQGPLLSEVMARPEWQGQA